MPATGPGPLCGGKNAPGGASGPPNPGGEAPGGIRLAAVPNGSGGTQFNSVFVARRGRGTDLDHKVVYLTRNAAPPPWPTDNV